MISVEAAEKIILAESKDYGTESVYFESALGRVLAENIYADRDLPPYNRVTMDGIAINYAAIENDVRCFKIIATQAAGDKPFEINHPSECIEIMTGAALPSTTDTVIRYEDVQIENGNAIVIAENISKALPMSLDDYMKASIEGLKTVFQDFTIVEGPTEIIINGKTGMTLVYTGRIGDIPVTGKNLVLVTIDGDTGYSITFGAVPETYSVYEPTFQKMLNSFKIND